jgi:hypothetical protein
MTNDAGKPHKEPRLRTAERRLAIAGAAVFAALLLVSIGLWVRHGEEIFFSRIVSVIANCF